jgi:uncharacterized MAPEG superfamily protein
MNTQFYLAATCVFTALLWLPYALNRFAKIGVPRSILNPGPHDLAEHSAWAQRAMKAHANAIENLAVFAPLVLLALHLGMGNSSVIHGAAATYFFARITHYAVYSAGIPVLRTLSFAAGFMAQLAIGYTLLTAP